MIIRTGGLLVNIGYPILTQTHLMIFSFESPDAFRCTEVVLRKEEQLGVESPSGHFHRIP